MSITSIKKISAIGALSSAVLLSGCSIPFSGEEEPAVSPDTAKIESTQNPEKLFFDFAKASGKNGLETIGLTDFDTTALVKSEADVSIIGDFNMEGTPMGGGTGTFEMIIDGKADYSDKVNPLLSEAISLKVDALGGLFKVDTSAEVRIVNSSVFAQFSKVEANFPGLTPEVKEIVQKFTGQWYGNSFTELNELVNTNFGLEGFDVQKTLAGGVAPMIDTIALIQDIGNNPQNHINFGKFVKAEDGYYFFEVTPKKETYEKFGNIIIAFAGNTGTEADAEITTVITEAIASISTESVLLAYTPEHPEYFKISKIIDEDGTKVLVENTAQGIKISIAKTEGDDAGEIVFTKTSEGKLSLIVDSPTAYNGERTELLSGTCTDTEHTFTISAPISDYELGEDAVKEVVKANFIKTGDAWAGEITSPEFENGKLIISDAKGNMYNAHAKISAVYKENTITNITFDIKSSVPATVTLETPENVKSFNTIQADVEKEMNALYGIEEVTEVTEVTTDDIEGKTDATTDDIEVVINNSEVEGKTDAVEVVIDADAQGGADYSEISGKLARMAELMNENPTGNAETEFLALKAEIDLYAAENDITNETLKELLLNEVVKQN